MRTKSVRRVWLQGLGRCAEGLGGVESVVLSKRPYLWSVGLSRLRHLVNGVGLLGRKDGSSL